MGEGGLYFDILGVLDCFVVFDCWVLFDCGVIIVDVWLVVLLLLLC